jgi:hypothetical protein
MSWSIGEIGALAVKASRGCGFSWGIAEEAGFAVKWLQARHLPGTAALCQYLTWYGTGHHVDWPEAVGKESAYCPLRTGTAFADGALPANLSLVRLCFPLLIVPFLACRTAGGHIRLEMEDIRLNISADSVSCTHNDTAILRPMAAAVISFHMEPDSSDGAMPYCFTPKHPLPRVPDHTSCCVNQLGRFAHNTYAPATEQSRLLGAGAGLNDND